MLTLTTWPRRRDKSASVALFDVSGRVGKETLLLHVFFYIGDLLNGSAMSRVLRILCICATFSEMFINLHRTCLQ